jgi:hypothetical protein
VDTNVSEEHTASCTETTVFLTYKQASDEELRVSVKKQSTIKFAANKACINIFIAHYTVNYRCRLIRRLYSFKLKAVPPLAISSHYSAQIQRDARKS